MSDSLADDFEALLAERGGFTWHADMFHFAWCNRDRILAALRVAEIVREPTDALRYQSGEYDDVVFEQRDVENVCRAILELANEAGERERQG